MERICTYGLFENLSSKEKVWVFNTHFDHIGIKAREKSTGEYFAIKTLDYNEFDS